MNYKRINVTFDETSPSIQYPIYKLSPYNSQNTFFHYEAFWSLYLPYTVTFRLTDIWRSYWAQRLMWLLNDTITFNGPNAVQFRNSHSYLKDFESEKSMYSKTESLIEFLFKWKCSKKSFYECVIDLSYGMAVEKFWEMEEVDSIRNWLHDLNKIGYKEPKIVNFEIVDKKCNELKIDSSPNGFFQVRYTPKFQKSIDTDNYCCDGRIEEIYDNYESIKYLAEFCTLSKSSLKLNPFIKLIGYRPKYSNINLLVTFNNQPYPRNIEIIRHIYGSYFKNIIFCGINIIGVLNQTKYSFKKFDSYTFIDVDVGWSGVSHYFCMTKAIEMKFSTEGILLMSDDVLLKYWRLDKYDLKKIWYPFKLECKQELVINSTNPGWAHWSEQHLNSLIEIWKYFDKIKNGSILVEKDFKKISENYVKTIAYNSRNTTGIFKNSTHAKVCSCFGSDIFYLPKAYFEKFHFISKLFKSHDLHLEIALPTILAGLEKNDANQILTGTYYWHILNFEFYNGDYDKAGIFLHPAKLSEYVGTNAGKMYCEKFIQEKINNYKFL
jgi:hypothetical protein